MEENKIEVEEIHYEQMNKTELVDVCRQQDTQLKNYEIVLNNERETNKETLSKIQEAYKKQLDACNALLKYYERKFKLIKDLLNIEEGEDK